jgi:ELWxxDGT repeat protein
VEFVVGDVIYFDEKYGGGYLYAYNTSNNTVWRVFETMESQTVYDVGEDMSMIVGDIVYFSGDIWSGGSEKSHLYAHNTSNGTTWRVPITSTYSLGVSLGTDGVVHGDNIYFTAATGGVNLQLWGYNSVNNTAWQATSTTHGFGCCYNLQIVGDIIYYTANRELWAYNTSNQSDWEVAEINTHYQYTSDPGQHMSLLVGDTIYFDADDGTTGRELWAYNTSNETYWRVADINNGSGGSNPGYNMEILVGDTIYFDANDGNTGWELWAHNTSNGTTWQAVDIKTGVDSSSPGYGEGIVVIGDTIYFGAAATNSSVTYYRELWAHDTSNHSTWQVSYLRGPSTGSNSIGSYVFLALGDTLYFSYTHSNVFTLWAYDTSNQTMWNTGVRPGDHLSVIIGNTIYLDGSIPLAGVGGLIAHQPGSVNYQTNTGGAVVSWAINGTLPSGVTFNNQTGVLSGTPTELWPQTSYMVWANNSGGTSVGYLNITVVDELPTLSYFPENLTLLNNTQSPSLPLAPTLNGSGIILEWGISPDLPSGLSFGSDNGTIWGVPTERMNTTMFTIWANNSGGSITANINITVLHQYPAFNYSVLDLMLVNNTAMTNVTSTVTGGEIVSWEVSPAMPVGILLDENGNISGLPTEVQNRTMYMVWANNTAGSHIVYINITIYDIIATLEYVPENITLTRNVTMTDLVPTHTGIIDSWAIWPALPDGLNFTNGTISGTPEYNMTRTNYTVYANNTGGSISHMINITIVEPVMDFEYIPYNVTLVNNTASSEMPMVPILYNDGVAETWEIWPALPSGLNFSSTNGTISGIATELQVIPVNYTIWANNSGGVGYAIISITVIDQLPNLTYPGDLVLMNNTNSSDLPMLSVLEGPGEIVTWEISHELPAGLNFSSENGTISGIATELMVKTQYTVWANNSGGSSMAVFNVTVVDQVPDAIGYNHLNMVLTKNENNSDFLPLTPNLVGAGNITSWEINGTLPAGLNFGTENGTIWGIPTELYHEWQYLTIYANNSGGTVISNISIMVNDQIPTIAYNLSQIVLKNDTQMISIEAIHGGGPFVTVAIHPELPAGMYFGYGNATIWGHPTELTSKIEYIIWANNSGGSASTTINITVEDNIPTFEYTSTEFAFYVDTEMDDFPLTVISTGGEIQNFSISPQLPAGLFFGELNGTIWGVATEDISETTFTITAYNPLGDYSIDVDIAVYDYLYNFELDPVWISNDSYMPKITPTYIIPGATYSIGPALPEGMSVNPYTGVVSGRPNGTMQLTSFTLIASVDGYTLSVPMKLGVVEDTDKDGLPDEIPDGGNALNLVEDPDDDNDNVEDQVELDCGSNPLDADDYPEFNSNGNCAPEPEGIGFLWCLPIILLLLLVLVAIIALWKKKDDVEVVPARTKPSDKKSGKEKWMQDYRKDDDGVEWGEDEEGSWWRREKGAEEWTEWDKSEVPSED